MKWLYRLAGKRFARKWDLQEGTMDETKPWWKSKTELAGYVTIAVGLYETARPLLESEFGIVWPEIPPAFLAFLGGLGVYGRRTATKKIG